MSSVTFPRLEALFSLSRQTWAERDDLRQRFSSIESVGYWNWLMAVGFQEYPEFLEHLPIPPEFLVERVVGDVTPEVFHQMGLSDAQNVYQCLLEAGVDLAQQPLLLDFGCGCGRLLRFFSRFADSCRLFGADVDAEAIDWCRANYDFASFETLTKDPPCPFADNQFDGVYAYSVFSHLTEKAHRLWLEELQRITKPGAAVVLTVQGRNCFEMFCREERSLSGLPAADRLRQDEAALERTGFQHYESDFALPWMSEEESGAHTYGMTFILEHYIREHWQTLFELVSFHEAPQGWQDYVILRSRK